MSNSLIRLIVICLKIMQEGGKKGQGKPAEKAASATTAAVPTTEDGR